MTTRSWFVVAIIGGVAAFAIGGSLIAVGLGGGGGPVPDGSSTVLRIESVAGDVPCGGTAAVGIYLDDLARRPSPQNSEISYGVAGFQFLLHYDPQIVSIAQPVDVELNLRLSQEDADGDGIARSFLPVTDIDDGAGRAIIGAASFVSQGGGTNNLEEGPDPVARGEPLLLMTVRFRAVGRGTAALALRDPEGSLSDALEEPAVFDPSQGRYEPLALKGASLTVAGGECPATAPPTPRPKPSPTPTPLPPQSLATPVPWRTVAAPEATTANRSDCPNGWLAYADPQARFSLCYPDQVGATASKDALNIAHSLMDGQGSFTVAILWSQVSSFSVIGKPSADTCPEYSVMGQTSSEVSELLVNGKTIAVCLNKGVLEGDAGLIATINGEVPLAADGSDRYGFINIYLGYVDSDVTAFPALAENILGTLQITFR